MKNIYIRPMGRPQCSSNKPRRLQRWSARVCDHPGQTADHQAVQAVPLLRPGRGRGQHRGLSEGHQGHDPPDQQANQLPPALHGIRIQLHVAEPSRLPDLLQLSPAVP